MGEDDVKRPSQCYRMKLLGAEVIPVTSGSKTLKDAMNEAMRDWVTNVDDTFYIIGTVAGPSLPAMVRDFQLLLVVNRAQHLEMVGKLQMHWLPVSVVVLTIGYFIHFAR